MAILHTKEVFQGEDTFDNIYTTEGNDIITASPNEAYATTGLVMNVLCPVTRPMEWYITNLCLMEPSQYWVYLVVVSKCMPLYVHVLFHIEFVTYFSGCGGN